jgi:hypothetical protein
LALGWGGVGAWEEKLGLLYRPYSFENPSRVSSSLFKTYEALIHSGASAVCFDQTDSSLSWRPFLCGPCISPGFVHDKKVFESIYGLVTSCGVSYQKGDYDLSKLLCSGVYGGPKIPGDEMKYSYIIVILSLPSYLEQ